MLGWKRVPYIWFGTLLQFGGFAIMPFALLVMSGDGMGPPVYGQIFAAVAFLMVGRRYAHHADGRTRPRHRSATEDSRPRVVALLYVMLLVGMLVSALFIGAVLADFTPLKLIKVIQGAGALTMALNLCALWKQEARNPVPPLPIFPARPSAKRGGRWSPIATPHACSPRPASAPPPSRCRMFCLSPMAARSLGLSVGQTTALTALWAGGTLAGFAIAARRLAAGGDPHRLAGLGGVAGIAAFAMVIFSAPLASVPLLCIGVATIGFGGGLFSVGTMTAAMGLTRTAAAGLALGAWGAVQATCAGLAILVSGGLRDGVSSLAASGHLGAAMSGPATGYAFVYHVEIGLLFATLVALGPLVGRTVGQRPEPMRFGMTEFQPDYESGRKTMSPILVGAVDVAELVFWAFVLFFIGLVFYLRREDRREGYPLEDDATGRVDYGGGVLSTATPKVFHLPFGRGTVTTPTKGREPMQIAARRIARFPGAPLEPTGNPLIDGIGPAAFADRAKWPDLDIDGHPRIVPLRAAPGFSLSPRDPNPVGMTVLGADNLAAGKVTDAWIDKADRLIRYLEVAVDGGRHVLVPMTMSMINRGRQTVKVDAVLARHFADAPGATGDTITLYEEERIVGYFGGGYLYATPERAEPFCDRI